MCCLLATKDRSRSIGPTEESVITLPLLDHLCAAVLLIYVWMCSKGEISCSNIRSCMSSAPSSGSFIVTYPFGLEEDTRRAWVVRENGEYQSNYWTSGSQHTPPIPDPDASIVTIQVEAKGSNLRRWVGLLSRLRTNSRP